MKVYRTYGRASIFNGLDSIVSWTGLLPLSSGYLKISPTLATSLSLPCVRIPLLCNKSHPSATEVAIKIPKAI